MSKKLLHNQNHWRNNLILLFCLVSLFIIGPAFLDRHRIEILPIIFISMLIFSGVFAADYKKPMFRTLKIIGAIDLIVIWADFFINESSKHGMGYASTTVTTILLVTITYALITHIASCKKVNSDIVLASINGYLLLGILGALVFRIIDINVSGSFSENLGYEGKLGTYIYYSFSTLTTVGYGDIVAKGSVARAFAIILSVSGTLYLTILIAMLIGKFQYKKEE